MGRGRVTRPAGGLLQSCPVPGRRARRRCCRHPARAVPRCPKNARPPGHRRLPPRLSRRRCRSATSASKPRCTRTWGCPAHAPTCLSWPLTAATTTTQRAWPPPAQPAATARSLTPAASKSACCAPRVRQGGRGGGGGGGAGKRAAQRMGRWRRRLTGWGATASPAAARRREARTVARPPPDQAPCKPLTSLPSIHTACRLIWRQRLWLHLVPCWQSRSQRRHRSDRPLADLPSHVPRWHLRT